MLTQKLAQSELEKDVIRKEHDREIARLFESHRNLALCQEQVRAGIAQS